MKVILYTLLNLLVLLTNQVIGQTLIQRPEQLIKLGALEMGNDSIESLPIYYQKKNLPFVKVLIDGKEYFFLFDTGASGCLVSKDIASKYTTENTIPIEDDYGNEINADVILINLKLGKSSFNKIACVVGDTKRLSELGCVKIDGVIGANLLRFCNWEVNPSMQTLSFSKIAFEKKTSSSVFNIELTAGNLPLINFYYDGFSFYTLIDSGFSDYFEMNNAVLKKSKKYKRIKKTKGFGQHSLTISSKVKGNVSSLLIDTLKTNDAFILNVPTIVNDSKPKLGSATLRKYIFTYNFLEKKIFLTPISLDTLTPLTFNVNFGLNDSNQLIINFIWLNDETEKLGLKIGQQITKIDNQIFNQLSNYDLCDLKNKLETKNKISISVNTGNKIEEFEIFKTARYPTN